MDPRNVPTVARQRSTRTALFPCAALLALACRTATYFEMPKGEATNRLIACLNAVMESRPMPGLSVAVVKNGTVIFARGFGVRRLGSPDPVTPATLFHTASVSKALVATAVLRLAVAGRLDLDAPVPRYLPYFRLADGREGEITRDPGFNALIALLPDRGVGLVLLSNYDGQSSFELVEIADGVFDVGRGHDPRLPKASIAVPIARAMASRGVDAAIAEYRRLRHSNDRRYQFGMSDLITLGHDLRHTGRIADAIHFYQMNAEEHPEYFASHLALATAYLQIADSARARDSYRTMLSMKPERYGCPESCCRDQRLEALLAKP